jgi:hypothetical protein
MTPKEKAEELFSKYYNSIEHTLSEEYSPHEMFVVKQCALIAVNEIIYEIIEIDSQMSETHLLDKNLKYWQEVKKEIEKL